MAEAVDPIILNMKLVDVCQCRPCDCSLTEIPQAILDCFGDSLTQGGDVHRLYVTLGPVSYTHLAGRRRSLTGPCRSRPGQPSCCTPTSMWSP